MLYPVGMLINKTTGRYHPIIFRMAPMPGGADDNMTAQRFKSLGHHTEGFATEAEAMEHIKGRQDDFSYPYSWTGRTLDWDEEAEGIPARVEFFSASEAIRI